jgi:shikimate dehydrogenase
MSAPPTGSTRVAAVIGDPIAHSLSPVIFNAAFEAAGLDWVFLALRVAAGDTRRALDGVRATGIGGLSVTMPHKDAACALVDELTPEASALGAVNCIENRDGTLVGHNTDGTGLLSALTAEGVGVVGERVVVLGAGGAARSVIAALGRAGAEVVVVNRSVDKAEAAAALGGPRCSVGTLDDVEKASRLINATSVGMGGGGLPVPVEMLGPPQIVVDLVYHPVDTPLLRSARARGARTVDGVGMLVHQGARAFELWTGVDAPVEAMNGAARAALAARAEAPR